MDARYLVDENGERVGVLLDIGEYERLIEELEELADIRAADEARREPESGEDEVIPFDQAPCLVRGVRRRRRISEDASFCPRSGACAPRLRTVETHAARRDQRERSGVLRWTGSFYPAGFVVVLISGKNQRLGDVAAGTLVVRE